MLNNSIHQVEGVVKETSESISKLINSGQSKVETGVAISKRCGEVLDEVVSNVAKVKNMMTEVTAGAEEQAEGVNNITEAMNQLDEATHANSNIANETSEYSVQLSKQSDNLNHVVAGLETELFGGVIEHDDSFEFNTSPETHSKPMQLHSIEVHQADQGGMKDSHKHAENIIEFSQQKRILLQRLLNMQKKL